MASKKIDDTKEKIVTVADRLFSRFGFHKTSIDEIAKTARKAKGSVYYHFASKEELFKEVVSKELNKLKSVLGLIMNDNSLNSSDKIKKYVTTRMDVLDKSLNYHETLKADFFEHYEFVDELRDDFDIWDRENIESIINQGIENGEFKQTFNVKALSDMFIMVLKGLEIPFFLQDRYKDYSTEFNNMFSLLTHGIAK